MAKGKKRSAVYDSIVRSDGRWDQDEAGVIEAGKDRCSGGPV